ncbi:cilia- and flagella-associated protein 91-like [Cydia splendana]|uniref:cilia- and flagella-associated protein 91-like n=1 Tax=Cydia splendana TaxID=1100963 RepID=UPI0028F4A872
MSETVFERRGAAGDSMRVHDYLYDSAFIVSGARDYARAAFKAAMASAQINIQPLYKTMFSELKTAPSAQVVYHPNCRLPRHLDRSYAAYVARVELDRSAPTPELTGKDRYRFAAKPKKLLDMASVTPQFHPPTPVMVPGDGRPKNKGTQSKYRESSAQTVPWQPDGRQAEDCENTPEVLYLDKLEWGPGKPFRIGDLPADFHTTEIINKMRHARMWTSVVESAQFPRWMKRRNDIINDVETRDWIFREAEIDELQDIRLELLHQLQKQQRSKQTSRTKRKLQNLWVEKKQEMERRVDRIRKTRDREIRKLTMAHSYGREGLVGRIRGARGGGSVTYTAADPTSDLHAPLARHGYQARRKHAVIYYDPSLLAFEDHEQLSKPPAWLDQCGQDLKKSCSGHHLPRDPMQLCERETKWSEDFLEQLHNDLKKARLGAGEKHSAGPLHVLKPRRVGDTPRPATPEVDAVQDSDETCHQAALTLQRIIRGRAVQCLMYEGRTRAAELTEELKTTHGLQKEDKIHIAKEEARARDHHVVQTQADREETAIAALVDELCGSTVSAALDFLEKELRRLKEERRQHAFLLIAVREKMMREAAEAGRRQKEEHRRREHDHMFRQIIGVTQETVDAYLHDVITEGIELGVEEEAVRRAERRADEIEREMQENEAMSTAEQNELVAELVQQFLLPEAHKCASRHRVSALQSARTESARKTIFGLIDDAEIKEALCVRCGQPLDEECRCLSCKITMEPKETEHRQDPRWKYTRGAPIKRAKTTEERFPPAHETRRLLNAIVDDAVLEARRRYGDRQFIRREYAGALRERLEGELEARDLLEHVLDLATGVTMAPARPRRDYGYVMRRIHEDALERTEPPTVHARPELPSEARARELAEALRRDPRCRCEEQTVDTRTINFTTSDISETEKQMLPSEVRKLEEMLRCKCDVPTPSLNPPSAVSSPDDVVDDDGTSDISSEVIDTKLD